MPLIDGQKVACVPCIRGHRSTKCNHAADRVMVPVRKPGRPLSSCACASGQSCACGGVKVAIPRKQKCRCGLDTADGDHADHDIVKPEMPTPALTPTDLPVSPTRNGVFRVQKPAPSSRPNGRKHSFDPAHLARVDPSSINIVNPYHATNFDGGHLPPAGLHGSPPQGHAQAMSGMAFVPALPTTGYQQPNIISYGAPLGYALVPIHSHLNNAPLPMPQPAENGLSPALNSLSPALQNGVVSSCCAPSPAPNPVVQPLQQVPPPQSRQPPKKSCCGGAARDPSPPEPIFATHQGALSNGNAPDRAQPAFMDVKEQQQHGQQGFPASYASPNVFTYPAHLGTWNQPLTPAMWAQLQQASPPQPSGQPFATSLPLNPNGGSASLDISHECSCGPGCQCVGCLAHPFNLQTRKYVEGAWDFENDITYVTNGSDKNHNRPSTAVNGGPAQSNGHAADSQGISSSGTNGYSTMGQGANGLRHPAAPETGSPIQAQTPSDASGLNEELPASDFLFVNLPLYSQGSIGMEGDSCGGSSAYCPCGDDCECIGCLVHNTEPLDQREIEE